MPQSIFKAPSVFLSKQRKHHIPVTVIKKGKFDAWLAKKSDSFKREVKSVGFSKGSTYAFCHYDAKHSPHSIYVVCGDVITARDGAGIATSVRQTLSKDIFKSASFSLDLKGYKAKDLLNAHIGWGLSHYAFSHYKDTALAPMKLLWADKVDRKHVQAYVAGAYGLRDLINIPANDMGPDEMEAAARAMATEHKAKVIVIKGAKLEKDFPLIHTVGKASPRAPRLIDIRFGKASDPKLTIIGKGVVFDTGGLDLKPSQYMRLMKKDMGGAAHALALGHLIMAMKLPVCLRILVPCVENAVGGAAFRPGDIIKSRKGLTVENTNTDAEGRLILADAITLASEEKPDLIIDFATLTGSARAALGPDIPAMFSNSEKIASELQGISMEEDDPLWSMPLWPHYKKTIESPIADLVNSAGVPGDLIYSALFLESFLNGSPAPDWVHLDVFAWENNGRAGRSKGGSEMGLRALYTLIEKRYAK